MVGGLCGDGGGFGGGEGWCGGGVDVSGVFIQHFAVDACDIG